MCMAETLFDLLLGLLALRFHAGTAPVFLFSVLDYGGQAVATLYLWQRSRKDVVYNLGRMNVLLFASFSAYEAAFKN